MRVRALDRMAEAVVGSSAEPAAPPHRKSFFDEFTHVLQAKHGGKTFQDLVLCVLEDRPILGDPEYLAIGKFYLQKAVKLPLQGVCKYTSASEYRLYVEVLVCILAELFESPGLAPELQQQFVNLDAKEHELFREGAVGHERVLRVLEKHLRPVARETRERNQDVAVPREPFQSKPAAAGASRAAAAGVPIQAFNFPDLNELGLGGQ